MVLDDEWTEFILYLYLYSWLPASVHILIVLDRLHTLILCWKICIFLTLCPNLTRCSCMNLKLLNCIIFGLSQYILLYYLPIYLYVLCSRLSPIFSFLYSICPPYFLWSPPPALNYKHCVLFQAFKASAGYMPVLRGGMRAWDYPSMGWHKREGGGLRLSDIYQQACFCILTDRQIDR